MNITEIKNYINKGNQRSVLAKKNIAGSFVNRVFAIVISLLLVPITINYLSAEQYGVWLTLSSIVAWVSYFDVGLVHGFKNKFAEAVANNDTRLARQYVSTTYFIMIIIFSAIIIIAEIINQHLDWASLLNISSENTDILRKVCAYLIVFVCIQLVLGVLSAFLMANQRPALSGLINTFGQGFALLGIFVLTLLPYKSMIYIAIALTGIPVLTLFTASLLLFKGVYKAYSPSIKEIRPSLIHNIISLGVKFFVIQLSLLLIFQVVNIILSRTQGPESVTLYNVTYKYFSVIQMIFNIILSPFWVAYTDAYVKKDFVWMRNVLGKLKKAYWILFMISFIQLVFSSIFFKLWLPSTISVSFSVRLGMFIYIIILTYSNMLMIVINGIGKVFLQSIIYAFFAMISIPLMYFLCLRFGVPGVLFLLSTVYAIQALFANIQLKKMMLGKAYGIWNK